MNIKLRARLSAYSKLSTESSSSLPNVEDFEGDGFVTVTNKKYAVQPVERITETDIDGMFGDTETTVSKEQIDSLFITEPSDSYGTVSKDEIDTLFDNDDEVGTVSFADIDSLFN